MSVPGMPAKITLYGGDNTNAGIHQYHFQLFTKEGLPAPGCIVRILRTGTPDGYVDLHPTDKHGTTRCEIFYKGKQMKLLAVVPGTELSTSLFIGKHENKEEGAPVYRLPEPLGKKEQETPAPAKGKLNFMTEIEQGYEQIIAFLDKLKAQGRSEDDIEEYREKMETLLLNEILKKRNHS